MSRPDSTEYREYYETYTRLVPDGDIVALLETQLDTTATLLRGLSDEQSSRRYAEGKWSVKEVVGHVTDAERMFGYRAFCFARRDPAHLPNFEQADYAASSNAHARAMGDLVDELGAVRRANVALFGSLDDAAWSRRGTASGCEFSVRALAYIIVGHEMHHRGVIEERYLSGG